MHVVPDRRRGGWVVRGSAAQLGGSALRRGGAVARLGSAARRRSAAARLGSSSAGCSARRHGGSARLLGGAAARRGGVARRQGSASARLGGAAWSGGAAARGSVATAASVPRWWRARGVRGRWFSPPQSSRGIAGCGGNRFFFSCCLRSSRSARSKASPLLVLPRTGAASVTTRKDTPRAWRCGARSTRGESGGARVLAGSAVRLSAPRAAPLVVCCLLALRSRSFVGWVRAGSAAALGFVGFSWV